jgi:hypothetical protein
MGKTRQSTPAGDGLSYQAGVECMTVGAEIAANTDRCRRVAAVRVDHAARFEAEDSAGWAQMGANF